MVAEEAGLQIGAELDGIGSVGTNVPGTAETAAPASNDLEARLAALRNP